LHRFFLGLAEFLGEGFAVVKGYGVKAVEDVEVIEEGGEGECEENRDHEPGAVDVGGDGHDGEGDSYGGDEDADGDEDAELGWW
jgi:hypothetical protein